MKFPFVTRKKYNEAIDALRVLCNDNINLQDEVAKLNEERGYLINNAVIQLRERDATMESEREVMGEIYANLRKEVK
jgi:hypothetical protein